MFDSKIIIAGVIRILQKHEIELQKITLHKFLYFLSFKGIKTGLSFEEHTYGPFSFDLARALSNMCFWEELKERKTSYEIISLDNIPKLSKDEETLIESNLQAFRELVKEFTFDNLELIGTALYCTEVLKFQGNKPTFRAIEKEFKGWKGNRYSSDRIRDAYDRIKPLLS